MGNFAPPAPSIQHTERYIIYILFLANKSRTNLLLIIHARAPEIWSSHFFARVWSEKRQFHNQQPAKPLCVSLPYNLSVRVDWISRSKFTRARGGGGPLINFQGVNSQNRLIGIYLFLGAILSHGNWTSSKWVDEIANLLYEVHPGAINSYGFAR